MKIIYVPAYAGHFRNLTSIFLTKLVDLLEKVSTIVFTSWTLAVFTLQKL